MTTNLLDSSDSVPGNLKRICVIGAGATGIAALRVIVQTPQYKAGLWKPRAFEARNNVGGIWLPAPPIDDPPITPLYDSLTTNLPHPIMGFPDFPFPPSTPLFPRANVVQTYLETYASHFNLMQHIELNISVQNVRWNSISATWNVWLSDDRVLDFDLVIVANGHYRVPRYPATQGLKAWLSTGRASHSAWYRHLPNLGKTVLVVGAGPSGQDISNEISSLCTTVIHSVSGANREDIGNVKRRGRISRFSEDGQVVFEDNTVETGIDHCILATGYQTAFPFFSEVMLHRTIPAPLPPLPDELCDSSYHVFPLAKHIFPLQTCYPPSALAFLGLLVRVAPFPLVEAQARAVVHAFAYPEALDITAEVAAIVQRHDNLVNEIGSDDPTAISKAWLRFQNDEQWDYRDDLHNFAGVDDSVVHRKVPGWVKEIYGKKDVLRDEWRELERCGEAEDWVRGVGEGPQVEEEWVAAMRRILRRAEERKLDGPPESLHTI